MFFLTAAHTDTGMGRKTNQDSMLIMQAETEYGNTLFASVCDGMGGLARGEAASAAVVRAFADWFESCLPLLIKKVKDENIFEEMLLEQWSYMIGSTSRSISLYGREKGIRIGTTAVGVFIFGKEYFTFNVGDSRAYLLADTIIQLTKDQTLAQRELDAGILTLEEARAGPERNVLLQCIGADSAVRPVFGRGRTAAGDVFLLCSDGFCREITGQEMYRAFQPSKMNGERMMKRCLKEMTGLNMKRGERDNISALLVKLVF